MRASLLILLVLPLAWAGVPPMMMEDMWKMAMEGEGEGEGHSSEEQMMGWKEDKGWKDDGMDYEMFIKMMKEEEEKQEREREKEEQEKRARAFKEYMEKKMEKERRMKEMKMELMKQMQMIQSKKKMTEELEDMSKDFMEKRMKLMFGVIYNFLGFCDCGDEREIFMRIKEGRFGSIDGMGGHMGGNNNNGTNGNGNRTSGNGDRNGNHGDMDVFTPSYAELMEFVSNFDTVSREEQVKLVVEDLIKVMCGAARQYLAYLRQIEYYLMQYRKNYMQWQS